VDLELIDGNWLVVSTYPEKYELVSWDDEIPNIWKNHPNVPNHQPGKVRLFHWLSCCLICGERTIVGGFNHLEKYSSMGSIIPHMKWKITKCSKPSTRNYSWMGHQQTELEDTTVSGVFLAMGDSPAPDAVEGAWTRTHARIYARKYVRIDARYTMPERMSDRMSEYIYNYIYIRHIYTFKWYVRNYVKIVCQGGDHSK